MSAEKPKLQVFIPVHKNHIYLKHMLETFVSNTKELEFTIINNGSDDDTNKFCKIIARRKGFTVHHYAEALGVSRVWNLCLDMALQKGYDQIIITNADILFHPTCIDTLSGYMDQNPKEVLACAMDIKKVIEVVQHFPELSEQNINNFKYSASGIQHFNGILNSLNLTSTVPTPVSQIVDYSCFMVRPKELVEKVGYFDENFLPAYWEDTDMHWRLAARGHITNSVLNAAMFHIHSRSMKEGGFKNDSYLPNGFYFCKKHNATFRQDQLLRNQQGQVFSLKTFNAPDAYYALEKEVPRKVYECFIFNNDLDLLEQKLELMHESVDTFVIVESPIDLNGKSKVLHLKENKERFAKFLPKMRRIIVQDFKNASTPAERQGMLMRALANGLKDAKINDTIVLSTEASLWDIRKVREFERMRGVKIMEQKALINFANVESDAKNEEVRIVTFKALLDDFNGDLAHVYASTGFKVVNGGWQFNCVKITNRKLQEGIEKGKFKIIPFNRRHIPALWEAPDKKLVFKAVTHKGAPFIDSALEK